MKPRHISLDFWHTLGEPNPAYSEQRAKTLSNYYGISLQASADLYKRLKNRWEKLAVETGRIPAIGMLWMQFNDEFESYVSPDNFSTMLAELRWKFEQHPPAVCPESLAAIGRLRQSGVTFSIGSNTNFMIRGDTVSKFVPAEEFVFQIYSDQLGRCKPSPEFFAQVILSAGRYGAPDLRAAEILHIGDSELCDSQAARRAGVDSTLCSGSIPLFKILNHVEEEYVSC